MKADRLTERHEPLATVLALIAEFRQGFGADVLSYEASPDGAINVELRVTQDSLRTAAQSR